MIGPGAISLRQLVSLAFVLVTLAIVASTPARATMESEVAFSQDVIRRAISDLDGLTDGQRKIAVLRDAVDAVGVLQQMGGSAINNEAARIALAELADEAITPDMLRLAFIGALVDSNLKTADGLKRDLDAKATLEKIGDPAYRAAGWTTLARAHLRDGQADEAERLTNRAIEDARGIERLDTRDGALRAAVLVFPPKDFPAGIVDIATNSMVSASARSEIYQMEAKATFPAKPAPNQDALATQAENALKKSQWQQALVATQAMDRDEDRRSKLLDTLFKASMENGDETLALEVTKSMARDRDQNKALRKLIDARIQRDKALRAQELVPLLSTVKARVDAEIAVAEALDKQGYRQMALDIITALPLSPADEPDAAAHVVAALAGLEAYEPARIAAAAITASGPRSFAYSRLIKRLADDQMIADAEALLDRVTEPDDRIHAQSGIARAFAKQGRLDEAEGLLEGLPQGPDRDRVLEELAKARVKAREVDGARKYLDQAASPASRGEMLIAMALTAGDEELDLAKALLAEATALLTPVRSDERLADLAIAYARIGDIGQSDRILDSISNSRVRSAAERRIAESLVKQGALPAARDRLTRLAGEDRAALEADLALAAYHRDGAVEALVESVKHLPYTVRVPTLRKMSEERARKLDVAGWLNNPGKDPLAVDRSGHAPRKANFVIGQQMVQAPAPETRQLEGVAMPDIFEHDAVSMRARVHAPADGVGRLAILGFSPFSLEAFKLTSLGTAAIHQVQVSQQLTWPRYIAIERGTVTLGSLLRDLPEAEKRNLLVVQGDVLLVRVPVIVLPGATLLMSGAEFAQYRLGARSGAFIAVAGRLVVQDADIVGYDEIEDRPAVGDEASKAVFRPFITAWGGSDLQIAGSRLAMLGYDSSKAFGLTQSSGAAVQSLYAVEENPPVGNIIDNSFENLRYGYYSYEANGVRLIGNEYRDNIVYGIDPHDRSRHLLIALNTSYGAHKKHGIIVSREVDDSFIVGNVSLWNKGSGIMLDRTSTRNIVYANTSVANHGDGLTFYESGCNIAAANEFSRNARAGIKVRNSTDVGMYDNLIGDNVTSGADIYITDLRQSQEGSSRNFELDPYEPLSTAVLSGNSFSANGSAINVEGASQMILEANRFKNQRSNIYGGDFRQLSPYLLQLGESSAMLVEMTCQPAVKIGACEFGGWPTPRRTEIVCTGMSAPKPAPQQGVRRDG